MTNALAALSLSISQVVTVTAPLLSAIRVGANRHVTGLVCEGDIVVTTDQDLPALDSYTVVLSRGHLAAARPGPREPGRNLAVLRLETPWPVANPEIAATTVGSVAVVVGADGDGSPTVRLTVVQRFLRTADGPTPVLDLAGRAVDPGSLVLDADGRLIGLACVGLSGEIMAIPGAVIGRMLMPHVSIPASPGGANGGAIGVQAPALAVPPSGRRGWLGVALQPITVPDALVARAGQTSGRMVVSITKGGPAELAGLRVGDVLLALNGNSASGPHALRALLGSERIGSTVEVRLLRDGNVLAAHLTIAARPG
jgi:S1-C subfamily serine protease